MSLLLNFQGNYTNVSKLKNLFSLGQILERSFRGTTFKHLVLLSLTAEKTNEIETYVNLCTCIEGGTPTRGELE